MDRKKTVVVRGLRVQHGLHVIFYLTKTHNVDRVFIGIFGKPGKLVIFFIINANKMQK